VTVQDPKKLHELLTLKQRELDLIMQIDAIRDTVGDPSAMLSATVNLITDTFEADLCMIALTDPESGLLEFKVVNDKREWLKTLDTQAILGLVERAFQESDVVVLEGEAASAVLGLSTPEQAGPSEVHFAVVPIIMQPTEHLGTLVLARTARRFDQDDVSLLRAAESQVDSAIIQGYVVGELALRNYELETIYRIDHIRDQELSFDDMLGTVLEELRKVIGAEMGFVMLYDHSGKRLELRAVTHQDLFEATGYRSTIEALGEEALRRATLIKRDAVSEHVRSAMCVPLILNEEILGVLGVANGARGGSFDEPSRRLLTAVASQMDTAIFESLERRHLKQVLGRSIGPRVMERLLENPDVQFLEGERQVLTVLYADIRDSTGLAAETAPEKLVAFINDYLGQMADIVLKHEGTLDKFVGDEVMALFGAPFPQDDHALRAVRVALEMQATYASIVESWAPRGVKGRSIGVGIASGEMIVGEMGSSLRTDYTVLGRAANLGARLCSAAEGGQVLISEETYQQVGDAVEATPLTDLHFKGIAGDTTAYHVTALKDTP